MPCKDKNHCGNFDKDGILLLRSLFELNRTNSNIFIDYNRFDNIDEIAIDDFLRYFDDIWYTAG